MDKKRNKIKRLRPFVTSSRVTAGKFDDKIFSGIDFIHKVSINN